MRLWFQRRRAGDGRHDLSVEELRREKSRVELTDLRLAVRERQLKIDAIQRVVEGEPDPVTALEVVTVATHRGRLSPAVYQRRQREQSPLETMAMSMLQKRLDEDPTDALERIIERQERLHEAAERLGGRGGGFEGESGNTFVDVARAVANSPLGEALGSVLGAGVQQRMAEAAAASGLNAAPAPAPTAGSGPPELGPAAAPTAPTGSPTPAGPSPRPVSFRVGMALRVLKSLGPADRARWILSQADQHPELGELIEPFLAAEPDAVPLILEAYLTEAGASGDAAAVEWVPLVEYLRDNMEWTLETHREMRALAIEDAEADEQLAAQ